jgi:hypothetical protein
MAVAVNAIGQNNTKLVLDLARGNDTSMGYPIADYGHKDSYNYDLSYGVALHKQHPLQGRYIGVKYYCVTKDFEWDMAKRIVHIYDLDHRAGTQKFYRLIHCKALGKAQGQPVYTNDYCTIDEITGVAEALAG